MPNLVRAQVSETDEWIYQPLGPTEFKRGINLGGAYGNILDRWMILPTSHWKDTVPPIDPAGFLTGAGHDTNNPVRLAALFDNADFNIFRYGMSGNPGYGGPGYYHFDHVVFNIDPHTFGADPITGAVPTPGPTALVDGHLVSGIWDAFVADVTAARNNGLRVLIAMHDVAPSAKWARDKAQGWANKLVEPGWSGVRIYPGPYRTTLFTRGDVHNYHSTITMNHPLPRFFSTFVGILKSKIALGPDIAFRVGSESLVFSMNQFDEDCVPHIPGYDTGQIFTSPEVFGRWLSHAKSDYRQIELMAARAIWEQTAGTGGSQCRIFVGSGVPWPEEYDKLNTLHSMGSWPSGTFRYEPYQAQDLIAAGFPEELQSHFKAFVYVVHQYYPFGYTHPGIMNLNPEAAQYEGIGDGSGVSWNGPPPPGGAYFLAPYQYRDYTKQYLVFDSQKPGAPYLDKWRWNYNFPPIVVTEFGAEIRKPDIDTGMYEPPPNGGGNSPPDVLDMDRARARFHYDCRAWFETRGIGWSMWNIFSGWNAYNGALDHKYTSGVWDFHPSFRYAASNRLGQSQHYPQFLPYMYDALFGERP